MSAPGAGRPMPCLAAGAALVAVPTLQALVAPSAPTAAADRALTLVTVLVLAVAAGSVAVAVARPARGGPAGLAVLCAGLALLLSPVEPWAAGLAGMAALVFLLAARMHAQATTGPVDTAQWLAARRPMLVGAAVTTPAALAAALVPAAWSLPVAVLVGFSVLGACAAGLSGR